MLALTDQLYLSVTFAELDWPALRLITAMTAWTNIYWSMTDCMVASISALAKAQRLLLELGPRRGYFPEPEKSILIAPHNTPSTDLALLDEFNFQRTDGHRYVGGFVGSGTTEAQWIDPQVEKWIAGVHALSKVAIRYPQTAYAGLSKSLQSEWQYVQRVTPNLEQAFAPLETAIAEIFLPALLDSSVEEAARLRPLIALPVRHGGLGLPDPTTTGASCYAASTELTSLLTASLLNGTTLCAQEHRKTAANGRTNAKLRQKTTHDDTLTAILSTATPIDKRRIKRSATTGAWLTTLPNLLNGSELSAEEFRDGVRLRLGLKPTSLPPHLKWEI